MRVHSTGMGFMLIFESEDDLMSQLRNLSNLLQDMKKDTYPAKYVCFDPRIPEEDIRKEFMITPKKEKKGFRS